MKARVVSVRLLSCVIAMLLCVAFFSPLSLAAGKARPITSLTPDERNKLPDNTEVTIKSGKTVTLGTLRADHRARMERFAKAAELGRIVAGKLKPHNQGIPMSSGRKTGSPIAGPDKPVVSTTGREVVRVTPQPRLVPFKMPVSPIASTTPKDYVDFCTAANSTVCLYFPAFAKMANNVPPHWIMEVDYLITDGTTCFSEGGWELKGGVCEFFYPMDMAATFPLTGPFDTKVACDPPAKYIVDDKGAVQVSYAGPADSSGYFTTGSSPITCVVQVWIEGK